MKTVKELCLGVAVAGMVAGAGSAVGCAVAAAEPAAEDTATEATQSRGTAAAATQSRTRDTGRAPSAAAAADSTPAPTTQRTPRRAATRLSAATDTNEAAGSPTGAGSVSASVAAPASAVSVADRVSTATAAVTAAPAALTAAPTAVAAPTAPKAAASTARVVYEAATLLLAAPVSPLQPVTPLTVPLPTPALPAAPASSTTVSASSTTSRSRSASVVASQIGDPDPTHVLLIGTDGTNLSKVLADPANVGFFDLMDESVTGTASLVGHTTISNPSWSTILTGVWDTKTGVINNLFNPAPYYDWPTVFNQLEYFDSTIDTAVVADWVVINDIAGAGSYPVETDDNFFVEFTNSWADTDQGVVDKTIELINNTSTTSSSFLFSYQVQVDEAGHAYGGGSPQFAEAITNVSDNIAEIMDAVAAREAATGEDWTVIVTTDHGHQMSVGFGHGFQSPNETTSFVIADLAGDAANDGNQNLGYSTVDITPTIVGLFGAPQRSDFDGVPIQSNSAVLNSIVDPVNLNQALNDAIAMYGYPNIGTDIALGVRTVFASIPYFLNGFVESITGQLQSIVDADIFLVSALAGVAEFVVQITGDILVGTTQFIADVVGRLTGAGVIPPSDPPLPPPPVAALLPAAVLV